MHSADLVLFGAGQYLAVGEQKDKENERQMNSKREKRCTASSGVLLLPFESKIW